MWWQEHWAELVGLLFVAAQAGVVIAQLRGVNARLDRVNGRLDRHGERIGELERNDSRRDGIEQALSRDCS
jgi:hypothetical protein